ncbi:hypothetical protein RQP46_006878 [Phenoliferia psychrophenolica]
MAPPNEPSEPVGSGTNLPPTILTLATICSVLATVLSIWTIILQLRNYRKITLQRWVIRILAFVIYCFFTLLVEYLGGERSLIILLHGRRPIPHPWPVRILFPPMDVSDPFTFLGLKRGILQYVQVKPILTVITVVLKATGTYRDGSLEKNSGYTYISIAYNVSYAFSYTDYIDTNHQYSGRLPFFYALRDAFGYKDVFSDSVTTVKGTGFSYRTFEPAEGGLHQGLGRDRRVRAGLRYAEGGKVKYWLPMPGEESDAHGRKGKSAIVTRPFHAVKRAIEERIDANEGYAPLGEEEASEVIHRDRHRGDEEYQRWLEESEVGREYDDVDSDPETLGFEDPEEEDDIEDLYSDSRRLEFGDYNYPVVDASQEAARRRMREEEEGMVHRHHPRKSTKGKGASRPQAQHQFSYGRLAENGSAGPHEPPVHADPSDAPTSSDHPAPEGSRIVTASRDLYHTIKGDDEEAQLQRRFRQDAPTKLPSDAFDLTIEDRLAEEEEMVRDRRRGEPGGARKRVYRQTYRPASPATPHESSDTPPTPVTPPEVPEVPGHKIEIKDTVPHPTSEEDGKEEEVVRVRVQEEVPQAREVDPPSDSDSQINPWN